MPYIGQGLTEGRRRAYNFVATGGQTTFSATYDVGYVDVFQNGILLTSSDYTATNGTTIVLGVGASASDEITIIAHQIFSVNDTVSASQGGTFSNNIDVTGNITTTGSVRGPSSFTIDPATHGDNTGTVVIAGDLTVNGTTTTINSTTLTVDDKNIIIASGTSNSSTADGSGLTIDLGSDGTATMVYTHATTSIDFNKDIKSPGATFTDDVTFTGDNYNVVWDKSGSRLRANDGAWFSVGTSDDAYFYHNFNQTNLVNLTGDLFITQGANDKDVDIRSDDGSGGTALYFKADGSTGESILYHYGSQKLATTSSGVTVTGTTYSSLNLGIRISSPAYNLHVHQDDSDASYALFTNTTTGTTANDGFRIGIDSNESALIWHREAEDIIFATSNTERMRIHSSGSLTLGSITPGIGDTAGTELTISDSIEAGITIRSGTSNHGNIYFSDATSGAGEYVGIIRYNHGSNYMMFQTNDSERMRIDSSGRVGIGTNDPSFPLSVQADSNAEAILVLGRSSDDIGEIAFRENDNSTKLGELQYRQGYGILRHRVGYLSFETGGATERMRIDSSGRVGIGTTNPSSPLHIQADGIALRMDGTGNTTRTIFFRSTTTSNPAQIYADGSLRLRTEDASTAIIFNTNSTGTNNERMRINSSGNVGINTTSPGSRRLKIVGSSTNYPLSLDSTNTDYQLEFQRNGTSEWWIAASASSFKIHENGVGDKLTVNSGGNVGIGTNNPGARLHVLNDSGSPAVNTNDTDPLIRLGTADGVHGGIDLHATQKYSTLRSTVYRTTSSNSFGFGYNAYNTGTINIGRVDQGYTWNATNGNGEYTGGVQQQPRYCRKAHFSGQIIANNTYYTIAENMSESRFTIECFCGDASSRDYKKYVGYYTSTAYGVYGLNQVIHSNGGWNSGSFDMRVSAPNGNLSIDLRFSSYYSSSNVANWMCIYTSFV